MKKLVFASAMALASICLVSTPALRAQDAGQISLPDRTSSTHIRAPAPRLIRRKSARPARVFSGLSSDSVKNSCS